MTDSRSEAVAHFAGGRLGPSDWTTLAGVAADHRGDLELVPRSGVRVRRADGAAVSSSELVAAGLPQRVGDERLPHVIASPMAGRLAGHRDLADLPERLGTELLRRAESALRGVLLVGFDDGSGDVLAHSPDLAVVAGEAGAAVRIHLSGDDVSVGVAMADAATVLADVLIELGGGPGADPKTAGPDRLRALVVDALTAHPLTSPRDGTTPPAALSTASSPASSATTEATPRVGWVDTVDGLVSLLAVVPRGIVPARLAEFLGAVERPSTVSADRVIGLHGLTEGMAEQVVRVLAPMGMVFDASSPWATGSR